MSDAVKIVECPRDAWQGLAAQIPARVKADYLRRLVDAGFRHIDAVSFVSAAAVPQMADSEEVLKLLARPEDVEIIGIVVNRKGAERAVRTGSVKTLGFPYSTSREFLRRNQHQTAEEALRTLKEITMLAQTAGIGVAAYLSMGFGNPYGEGWSVGEMVDACTRIAGCGVGQISLADTVGVAGPERIAGTVGAVIAAHDGIEIGVHLHARRAQAAERIRAAFDAGCRRFDGAMGGLGGCPFAQDGLVGNIPTEILVGTLKECGAEVPELIALDDLIRASVEIANGGEVFAG
ncbi:MAG: hydroxymethylglutaryl-CoA lyase [Terracidiphilus sp.]